ncbi:MAG: DNA photolyase family protein [Pseudorhodoplanes sp.]|nr:DNA photolyase family protein [Pseudorhodoplanes sp.]
MNGSAPVIVWFRDDLRLCDHPALHAGARAGMEANRPLICLYIVDEESAGLRRLGAAARWWLAQSLRALDGELSSFGQRLILRRGSAPETLAALVAETDAALVYWNRRYDAAGNAVDQRAIDALKARGVAGGTFPGNLLIEPDRLTAKATGPIRVFTPFWRRVLAAGDPRHPLAKPVRLPPPLPIAGEEVRDLNLEPTTPDWSGRLRAAWTPGERTARARLASFLDGCVRGYAANRDRPDIKATSFLSAHLRFGEISPVEVFHAARLAADTRRAPVRDIDKFLSEIGWREFSGHLLHHWPDMATRNLQSRFDAFPWRNDPPALKAWQRGRTGYPLVDAGMRQLWQTGWMHNRVRMVAASFLVKHLLIDWRAGEQWFWDTLVDADAANNPASWQWVAGCGADAAPYFRIFNPVLQGEKFDPKGDYVRTFVPELADLPDTFIHKPWLAPSAILAQANVALGENYPAPIVEHDAARRRALAAFAAIKA